MNLNQYSISAAQPGLSVDQVQNLVVPYPKLDVQNAIARFLRRKIGQIDHLIEKKQALIKKLNEKRTAMITRAVTKGLDETVPMKDSGVEWLGEVPKHWEVRRIKQCAMVISKGTTPSTEGREILRSGPIRFIKAENLKDGSIAEQPLFFIDDETNNILRRSQLDENDVLFVIAGATLGKTAIVQTAQLQQTQIKLLRLSG